MARVQLKTLAMIAGAAALCACGGSGSGSSSSAAQQSTVNFVVTDAPSSLIAILSFQVQITGAILQPGNVALLPRPVTVDLAQLASDTGLLASTVIDSATYTSLTMTYANPQVTLQNNSGGTLTLNGQSCAPGATCTYAPVLNSASVTISNGVFPLTLAASGSTGIKLDLSIPDLLQSDLSVTFANGSSVNLSVLPNAPIRIDDMLATVNSVSGSELHVTTAFGDQLVLDDSAGATYQYADSECSTANLACVTTGQEIAVDATLGTNGALNIDSVSYVGAQGASVARALVLAAPANGSVELLLLRGLNLGALSPGTVANATLGTGTSYAMATAGYPSVAGVSFAGAADLIPGQVLIVGIGPDVTTGTVSSFTSPALYLDSTQLLGSVASLSSGSSSLSIDALTGLFTDSGLHVTSVDVQTGTGTSYVGGASGYSSLSTGQALIVKGPLFAGAAGGTPVLAAEQVTAR